LNKNVSVKQLIQVHLPLLKYFLNVRYKKFTRPIIKSINILQDGYTLDC
jgi:hypothetical protein